MPAEAQSRSAQWQPEAANEVEITVRPSTAHAQHAPLSQHTIFKMAVSALDSRVFRNLFGTQEVRDIFTDDAYAGFLVEVEAALARAEAAVGVIPAAAGEAITSACANINLEYGIQFSLFLILKMLMACQL